MRKIIRRVKAWRFGERGKTTKASKEIIVWGDYPYEFIPYYFPNHDEYGIFPFCVWHTVIRHLHDGRVVMINRKMEDVMAIVSIRYTKQLEWERDEKMGRHLCEK